MKLMSGLNEIYSLDYMYCKLSDQEVSFWYDPWSITGNFVKVKEIFLKNYHIFPILTSGTYIFQLLIQWNGLIS